MACDHYVFEILLRVNTGSSWKVLAQRHAPGTTSWRFGRYIARSLADGSPTARPIFDEIVVMTEQWLVRSDEARPDTPSTDRRVRAALVTSTKVGIPLLHEHVSRVLGVDIFEQEGERLAALALLDIYSHSLIDVGTANSARDSYEKRHG